MNKRQYGEYGKWKIADLTNDGAVWFGPRIPPGNHSEIDNGDEACSEQADKMVDYEISTVRTERLVVERHGDFLTSNLVRRRRGHQ